MATGPPWVSPCRMPPSSLTASASNFIRAPRPKPSRRRASASADVAAGHLDVGRHPLQDRHQRGAVGLSCGQPAQHGGKSVTQHGRRSGPAPIRTGRRTAPRVDTDPVISPIWSTAWPTSRSRPLTTTRPAAPRPGPAGSARVVHGIEDQRRAGGRSRRCESGQPRPAVTVETTRSAVGSRSPTTGRRGRKPEVPRQRDERAPLAGVRATTVTICAPSRLHGRPPTAPSLRRRG